MGIVIANASMSLDGFVAHPDNMPGRLFDWYEAGDIVAENEGDLPPFHLTETSHAHWKGFIESIGCLVVGRTLFDVTDGWKGEHPLGVPFVVLTHDEPTDWQWSHTGNARFVTDGIEAAVSLATDIAGDLNVAVAAGTIAGQALAAGLVDEVAIDLVPVVLGEGHPFFADVDPAAVRLGDPTVVIPSARVTHMVFPVER